MTKAPSPSVLVGLSRRGILSRLTGRILEEQGAKLQYLRIEMSENVDKAFGWNGPDSFDAETWSKESGKELHILDLRKESEAWLEAQALRSFGQFWSPDLRGVFDSEFLIPHLVAYAKKQGLEKIATGHRARVSGEKDFSLMRSRDTEHDQSAWLAQKGFKALKDLLLPMGYLKLSEIQRLCSESGFQGSDLADEGGRLLDPHKLREILDTRALSRVKAAGFVIDINHNVLGEHSGLMGFSLGSRRGLESMSQVPSNFVVIGVDLMKQWLVVGAASEFPASAELLGARAEWCTPSPRLFLSREVLDLQAGFKDPLKIQAEVRLLADSMLSLKRLPDAEALGLAAAGRRITLYRGAQCLGATQSIL